MDTDTPLLDEAMVDLFRSELKTQIKIMNEGLLIVEKDPSPSHDLSSLMRAAHSIKGASKVLGLNDMVHLSHSIENCLQTLQSLTGDSKRDTITILFQAIDFISELSNISTKDFAPYMAKRSHDIESLCAVLSQTKETRNEKSQVYEAPPKAESLSPIAIPADETLKEVPKNLQLSVENFNKLMAAASELIVEIPKSDALRAHLHKEKSELLQLEKCIDTIRHAVADEGGGEGVRILLQNLNHDLLNGLATHERNSALFDRFVDKLTFLSEQLYLLVCANRLSPFGKGVEGFPRMVRDISFEMGKKVRFEIIGESVLVDREVLEKLIAPLSHLLRNAIDHGIEMPEERLRAGKSEEGSITLEVSHRAGRLFIQVTDDGRGVDFEKIKAKAQEKGYFKETDQSTLNDEQWLQCIFMPGFSTTSVVNEISGRGVGLNSVKKCVAELGGSLTTILGSKNDPTHPCGLQFQLSLPLSLSVIYVIITEISRQLWGFPLSGVKNVIHVDKDLCTQNGTNLFFENIPLLHASDLLTGTSSPLKEAKNMPIIVCAHGNKSFGVIVDSVIGVRECATIDLSQTCGKIPLVSTGALIENDEPVLIIDSDAFGTCAVKKLEGYRDDLIVHPKILCIDDSEHLRKWIKETLEKKGYSVKTAYCGQDGWNALCEEHYDLVITDIEMPQMNGLELLSAIKANKEINKIPVIAISAEGDIGNRALERGAAAFFAKDTIVTDPFIHTIDQLIGGK